MYRLKSKEVLRLLQISRVTLTRYVKSGRVRVKKLPKLIGKEYSRKNVIYARVSTNKQKNDLQNQIDNIRQFMSANGIIG